MYIRITDLCGRESPRTVAYSDLDAETKAVLDEFMDECDGPWCIGEFRYDDIGN